MASIATTLQITDNMTAPLRNITDALHLTVGALSDMRTETDSAFDASSFDGIYDALSNADAALIQMTESVQGQKERMKEPVDIPVTWDTSGMTEVFTSTGVERFKQEISSANSMLHTLSDTQAQISAQAANTALFPNDMIDDLSNIGSRISAIQDRIAAVERNPLNMGTAAANSELEQLRSQLNMAVQQQGDMNDAIQKMDISSANDAYNRLNQTVSTTERYIRDNVDEQGQFTSAVDTTTGGVDKLNNSFSSLMSAMGVFTLISKAVSMVTSSIDSAISRYDTLNNFPKVMENMGFSAETASMAVDRLSEGISGLPTTLDGIVASTQKIAILKGDLGLATETALALNNAFYASNTSAADAERGLTQYVQMLSKGKVDAQSWLTLQETMGYALNETAEAFGYTGDAAQNDLYSALQDGTITFDEFNAKLIELSNATGGFAEVAQTATGGIETAWNNLKTGVTRGVTDIVSALDQMLANTQFGSIEGLISSLSETINQFLGGLANAILFLSPVIDFVLNAFQMLGNWISENWETVMLAAAIAVGIFAVKMLMAAAATLVANAPLILMIAAIVLLSSIIVNVAKSILDMGDTATTVLGVISGGVNIVIQWFKNFGLEVANIAKGIWNALNAIATNMVTAFKNAIKNVQSFFYNLLSTVLTVVGAIAEKLNTVLSVIGLEIDTSGLTSKAAEYADKALKLQGEKSDYESLEEAFNEGMNTFDTWQDGWMDDAYEEGAAWGDGVMEELEDLLDGFTGLGDEGLDLNLDDLYNPDDLFNPDDYDFSGTGGSSGIGGSGLDDISLSDDEDDYLSNIDTNTANIATAVTDTSDAELKYLREIAEKIALSNATPIVVNVDMSNMNNTVDSSKNDIDGLMNDLTNKLSAAVVSSAQGVHA